MNNLKLMPMTTEGKVEYVVDSREVAEMLGKEHCDLSKNIKVYMKYLAESNFSVGNFFIESSYKDFREDVKKLIEINPELFLDLKEYVIKKKSYGTT